MKHEFPAAVPEIPVADLEAALAYYQDKLGFTHDWGDPSEGNIAGISRGECRMFLTDRDFRQHRGNTPPLVIWLNLENNQEVDELYGIWNDAGAKIISPPESKPWKLHEFTVSDLDGNVFRVFYDFSGEV